VSEARTNDSMATSSSNCGPAFLRLTQSQGHAYLAPASPFNDDFRLYRRWFYAAAIYNAACALPWSFGRICMFNDLIWWPVFWRFALTHALERV
jgi:hypothetical protein